MSLQTLTYFVVGASFALYIAIAIWSRAHTTGDFYIAGKTVSPLANGMATAADWMSAASFISMAGLIAFLGYRRIRIACIVPRTVPAQVRQIHGT
jgi:cation/acetate symporter